MERAHLLDHREAGHAKVPWRVATDQKPDAAIAERFDDPSPSRKLCLLVRVLRNRFRLLAVPLVTDALPD